MLHMLDNIIILKPSMFFYYDHITMTVSYDMYDLLCDHDVILNPNPK